MSSRIQEDSIFTDLNDEEDGISERYCPFELPYDEYGDMMFERRLATEGSSSPVTSRQADSRRGSTVGDTDGEIHSIFPQFSFPRPNSALQNHDPHPLHLEVANQPVAPVKPLAKLDPQSFRSKSAPVVRIRRPTMPQILTKTPVETRRRTRKVRKVVTKTKKATTRKKARTRTKPRPRLMLSLRTKRVDREVRGLKHPGPSRRIKSLRQGPRLAGLVVDVDVSCVDLIPMGLECWVFGRLCGCVFFTVLLKRQLVGAT